MGPVKVEGLEKFRRAVRKADRLLGPELRKGLNRAAALVVDEARPTIPVQSGRLRQSLRARSTQRDGRVVLGSKRVPYAGFIEFGGRVGKGKRTMRPRVREGRYLRPAFARRRRQVMAILTHVVADVARKAGLR